MQYALPINNDPHFAEISRKSTKKGLTVWVTGRFYGKVESTESNQSRIEYVVGAIVSTQAPLGEAESAPKKAPLAHLRAIERAGDTFFATPMLPDTGWQCYWKGFL